MVAKMVKKTPTKSIKNRRNKRKKTPIKNAPNTASLVVASINKSLHSCHRRLVKIFSRLARITTPKKTPRKMGYQIVQKFDEDHQNLEVNLVPRALFTKKNTLLPLMGSHKNTIFLDLDETLVHSQAGPAPERFDFVVKPVIDGVKVEFFVLKRPFLEEFLEGLSEKFEIVVFTAGLEEYASLVLDKIDQRGLISHRLYRDSCKEVDGKFVKDLSEVGRELSKVVIVDDNPNSYMFQPENAIPIRPFVDDNGDGELRKVFRFLKGCDEVEDMRDAVKVYLQAEEVEEEVNIEYSKIEL